jgi:hypothetical protein
MNRGVPHATSSRRPVPLPRRPAGDGRAAQGRRLRAEAQGISVAFTKEYLGDKAEQTVMNRIKEAGGPANYDLTWFGFSNGVDCKTKEKVCHVSKHSDKVDAAHTKALFGR